MELKWLLIFWAVVMMAGMVPLSVDSYMTAQLEIAKIEQGCYDENETQQH